MGSTRLRRPPAPTDAERARSLALRGGDAALVGTGSAPVTPLVHHVRADGSAVLLLDDDEPLLERVRGGQTAVMLELADRAPVDLREPVRGLLWITGWLWLPEPAGRAPDGAAGGRRSPERAAARARPRRHAGPPRPGLRRARRRRRLRRAHARRPRRRPPGPVLPHGGPLAGPPRGGAPRGVHRARPAPAPGAGPLPGCAGAPAGRRPLRAAPARGDPAARPRRAPGLPRRGLDAGGAAGADQPTWLACPLPRARRRNALRSRSARPGRRVSPSPAPPGPPGPGA